MEIRTPVDTNGIEEWLSSHLDFIIILVWQRICIKKKEITRKTNICPSQVDILSHT